MIYWLPNGNGTMASNAHYTVYFNGGSKTYYLNETSTGGSWKLLGTHPFAAGTSGRVTVTNNINNLHVLADAVKFVKVQ